MNKNLARLGVVTGLALASPLLHAGQVSGQVRVIGRGQQAVVPTVVYAESLAREIVPPAGRFTMTQRDKTFIPAVLAIPVGSTVDFPNEDLIFHNVFSLSRPAPFDLGLYRAGASKSRTFLKPAIYRVFCNIHPQMAAVILVLPTPFIAFADPEGRYRFDLPAGRFRITAWSERSQPASIEISTSENHLQAPDLTLDESNFVEMPHKNKHGHDYQKESYDPLKDTTPK